MDCNKKIAFRVDGNNDIIGLGHVMRCIHLAEEFKKNGYNCYFIMKDFYETVNKVEEKNFEVDAIRVEIEMSDELNMVENFVKNNYINTLILDRWDLKQEYLDEIKNKIKNFVVINDFEGLNFKDLFVINVNDNITYRNEVNELSCIGLSYAIIPDNFLNYRNVRNVRNKDAETIVISMGGSDAKKLTKKVLEFLNKCEGHYEVITILGPGYKFVNEIEKLNLKSKHEIEVISNPKSMVKYFAKADIAITSGGMTKFEISFMGIPSIVLCQNVNEDFVTNNIKKYKTLINLGVGTCVEFKEFYRAFNLLINNFDLRNEMSMNGKRLIDGLGKKRIVERVEKFIEINQ